MYVSAGPHSILILGRFTRITQTGRACPNRKVHRSASEGRGMACRKLSEASYSQRFSAASEFSNALFQRNASGPGFC